MNSQCIGTRVCACAPDWDICDIQDIFDKKGGKASGLRKERRERHTQDVDEAATCEDVICRGYLQSGCCLRGVCCVCLSWVTYGGVD